MDRRALVVAAIVLVCAVTGVRAAGLDANAIDAAARPLPRLYSLLVSQRGELIFERYYRGRGPAQPANIKSASKSIISALVAPSALRAVELVRALTVSATAVVRAANQAEKREAGADVDGEVVKVYVESGQAVQYGERLFAIKARSDV